MGVGRPQCLGLLERQPGRDVAVQRIVGARLVGHHVDLDAAPRQLRQHLGGVAEQADRQRAALGAGGVEPGERVVERARPLVEVARLDPPLDPLQVDLDAQRAALVERHRQRLGAAHAAQPGRHHEPSAQRAAEAPAGDRRERLVGALEDALGPDVDPGPRGHLAVHHQPGGVELAERVPVRPVGHEVGVGDQHARRVRVGLEHAHRLARLHEQRLAVAQAHQLALDRLERGRVARRLADPAVDDEVLRALGDVRVQVVLEHPQRRLLDPAAAPHSTTSPVRSACASSASSPASERSSSTRGTYSRTRAARLLERRRALQRPVELEPLDRAHQLGGDHLGGVLGRGAGLEGGQRSHRVEVLLAGAGRDRARARRVREHLRLVRRARRPRTGRSSGPRRVRVAGSGTRAAPRSSATAARRCAAPRTR